MAVERHDAKKEECKKANNSSAPKREGLDGGSLYWAQESPQEAAVKSIKVKQQQVEMRLTSKMQEAADEDEAVKLYALVQISPWLILQCKAEHNEGCQLLCLPHVNLQPNDKHRISKVSGWTWKPCTVMSCRRIFTYFVTFCYFHNNMYIRLHNTAEVFKACL